MSRPAKNTTKKSVGRTSNKIAKSTNATPKKVKKATATTKTASQNTKTKVKSGGTSVKKTFTVKAICGRWTDDKGELHYHIEWEGDHDKTWEPGSVLRETIDAEIDEYDAEYVAALEKKPRGRRSSAKKL